ncbi:MAG: AMP-binding protein, partial [Myxococcota bacterium]
MRGTGQGGTLRRLAETVEVLGGAGFLNPRFLATLVPAIKKFGTSSATGFHAAAARNPEGTALIDELGSMSFRELDRSTNAIARALARAGVKPGDGVGLFARNHRGFVQAQTALDKLGANTLLLNTGFAAPPME